MNIFYVGMKVVCMDDAGWPEPSVLPNRPGAHGGTYNAEHQPSHYSYGCDRDSGDDREVDVQDEPHDPDPDESSLGSLNCVGSCEGASGVGFDQRRWAAGENDDLEDQHDGREPDEEAWFVPAVG